MNIKRSKDGCTSVKILPNQKITYDPGSDSYVIETDLLDGQIHRSTIPSHILDELHNRAWEGKRPNRDGYYWCEKHSHEQTEPCPDCKDDLGGKS